MSSDFFLLIWLSKSSSSPLILEMSWVSILYHALYFCPFAECCPVLKLFFIRNSSSGKALIFKAMAIWSHNCSFKSKIQTTTCRYNTNWSKLLWKAKTSIKITHFVQISWLLTRIKVLYFILLSLSCPLLHICLVSVL